MQDHSTIVEAVAPVLAARNIELYDVEISGTGRGRVVRVLVTSDDLDTIGEVAEGISRALDEPAVAGRIPGPYALEVSSPGLERPLRRADHYRGAIGETVSVKAHEEPRVRGTLTAADDTGFELSLADGGSRRYAYGDVEKARTVFEWGATASPKTSRSRSAKEVARR